MKLGDFSQILSKIYLFTSFYDESIFLIGFHPM